MRYDKLVRDRIPEIVKSQGKDPLVHVADDVEYFEKLKEKLQEEVGEFLKSGSEEELADILETIRAIVKFSRVDERSIEDIRRKKALERGGFEKRIILEEIR